MRVINRPLIFLLVIILLFVGANFLVTVAFVNQLSQINHGRTFFADKNNLGEYLLVDYLNSKRKYIS